MKFTVNAKEIEFTKILAINPETDDYELALLYSDADHDEDIIYYSKWMPDDDKQAEWIISHDQSCTDPEILSTIRRKMYCVSAGSDYSFDHLVTASRQEAFDEAHNMCDDPDYDGQQIRINTFFEGDDTVDDNEIIIRDGEC